MLPFHVIYIFSKNKLLEQQWGMLLYEIDQLIIFLEMNYLFIKGKEIYYVLINLN